MTSLVELLEGCIRLEYGPSEMASVRTRLSQSTRSPDATASNAPATQASMVNAMLRALYEVRRRPPSEIYIWAGTKLAPAVLKDDPGILKDQSSLRTMLLQLHLVSPPVLAKLSPGTECPDMWEDLIDSETTRINFDGPAEAAWVLEGLIKGICQHFGEWVAVTEGMAPSVLKERRILEVKVRPERREITKTPPAGRDRRQSGPFGGAK